jgi:hypothetical protein
MAAILPVLLAGATAWAQDVAPRVDHTPTASAARGTSVEIRALITSPAGYTIFEPAVFVRLSGLPRFTRLEMKPDPQIKGLYLAVVPAQLVTGDFDYYLEAFDDQGNGPGRSGSPESPLRVSVAAPVQAAAAPASDRPVQIVLAPTVTEPRSHKLTGTLAVIGGLATGVGLGGAWMVKTRTDELELARSTGTSYAYDRYRDNGTFVLLANIPLAIGGALLTSALISALWPEDEPVAAKTTVSGAVQEVAR